MRLPTLIPFKLLPFIIVFFMVVLAIGLSLASIAHDPAPLNAKLKLNEIATTNAAAAKQKAWESQIFKASPNVIAKRTSMISPMNASGKILQIDILTYWDAGRLRYATNTFDKTK
jgi:hypothetical protein